jgi:hypothetical protein
MEFVKVESSNIETVAYVADCQLMRVRYKDGTQYDHLNVSAQAHAALMAAPSKGKHLREHFPPGVRCLADGGPLPEGTPYLVGEQAIESPAPPEPADIIVDDEIDSCCKPRLMKVDRTDIAIWVCGKCGQEWRPIMLEGVKTWQPYSPIMFWR